MMSIKTANQGQPTHDAVHEQKYNYFDQLWSANAAYEIVEVHIYHFHYNLPIFLNTWKVDSDSLQSVRSLTKRWVLSGLSQAEFSF